MHGLRSHMDTPMAHAACLKVDVTAVMEVMALPLDPAKFIMLGKIHHRNPTQYFLYSNNFIKCVEY